MAIALSAQDGGDQFDHDRIGDVHDLRRGLPVLSGQELDRALSAPGVGDADYLDDLSTGEQLDDRVCRTCSATRATQPISILVDGDDLPGSGLSRVDGPRMAQADHRQSPDD